LNIALVKPPAYSSGVMGAQLVPYLGIAYIAAMARDAGHTVSVIDMVGSDIDRTEVVMGRYIAYGMSLQALREEVPPSDIIGITCTFSQDWVFHREIINTLKTAFPESLIVAGGEHITAIPEYCLSDCEGLDVCIIGEGEQTFLDLISAVQDNISLDSVEGIVYKKTVERPNAQNVSKGTFEIKHTKRRSRIKDIDSIPLPAWDLFPISQYLDRCCNYHIQRGRTLPILASRGCPYKCTFCSNQSMWGAPWIARDPKKIVDEMQLYISKYQVNNFVFSDLSAVIEGKKILQLCNEILDRQLDITWQLPTLRTEALNGDILALMYKAGCRELDFAIESGSKEVLKSVNKKNDPEKMSDLIKKGLALGFNFSINVIIGLPKERLRDYFSTYKIVIKLAIAGLHEINVFPFIPYPGSALFNELRASGKIKLDNDFFLSLFGYADLSKAVSWSEYYSPRMLIILRLFMLISFYTVMLATHPKRAFKTLLNVLSGKAETKLEGVLKRIFRNIKAYFTGERLNVNNCSRA